LGEEEKRKSNTTLGKKEKTNPRRLDKKSVHNRVGQKFTQAPTTAKGTGHKLWWGRSEKNKAN